MTELSTTQELHIHPIPIRQSLETYHSLAWTPFQPSIQGHRLPDQSQDY